jgi:hypothetical protein
MHFSVATTSAAEPERTMRVGVEYADTFKRTAEPVDMSSTRLANAWRAVDAIVEASSLSTDSVARFTTETTARPSPDQVREAAQWLELLADALEKAPVQADAPGETTMH